MITTNFFWVFVLAGPLVFWLLPRGIRLGVFAVVSAATIAWFDPLSAAIIAGIIAMVALAERMKTRNRAGAARLIAAAGLLAAGLLIAFKTALAFEGVLAGAAHIDVFLPLGISYFSFKLIHYCIDFLRGRDADFRLDLFVVWMFLPVAFAAGPIQRYDRFLAERADDFEIDHLVVGATRISYGLIKQFLIVALVLEGVKSGLGLDMDEPEFLDRLGDMNFLRVWLYLTLFYIGLYLNFSAYTDIAIGASRFFGFRIMENFAWPVLAASIDQFWQRWHMTLTGWCREYVYQPVVGLSRNPYLASYATFMVIGLWHEFTLNRLFWGLLHGTALTVYFYISRRRAKQRPRGPRAVAAAAAAPRSRMAVFRPVIGWGLTQGFVVASMAALVVSGNNLLDVGRIWLALLPF